MLNRLIIISGALATFMLGCVLTDALTPAVKVPVTHVITRTITVIQRIPVTYIPSPRIAKQARYELASAIPASAITPWRKK